MQETFTKFFQELKSKNIAGKELYEQYAICKQAINVLTDHATELNGLILDEMNALEVDKQTFDFGAFTKGTKTNWEYSPNIYQKEKELKALKAEEQEKEIAVPTKSTYLLYK